MMSKKRLLLFLPILMMGTAGQSLRANELGNSLAWMTYLSGCAYYLFPQGPVAQLIKLYAPEGAIRLMGRAALANNKDAATGLGAIVTPFFDCGRVFITAAGVLEMIRFTRNKVNPWVGYRLPQVPSLLNSN